MVGDRAIAPAELLGPPYAPASPAPFVSSETLLRVQNLKVEFHTDEGVVRAVDDVSFDVRPGETLGIVGESGSGKSVTSMAILGLLPRYAHVSGEVYYRERELITMKPKELRNIRGKNIAMIFQDALASLNPVFRVGDQIAEAIKVHNPDIGRRELHDRVCELLDLVGIPNPSERAQQYPHEFSGGMRQRVMIAMSISNEPDVLIADEPTTALDVTIQAQVMEVIERIQDRTNSAIVLITHDLGVVAGVADRVMVMYAGRQAELGSIDQIFYEPKHPYTRGLLASLPRLDRRTRDDRLHRIKGQPPSLIYVPTGCPFHPRCPYAEVPGVCDSTRPPFLQIETTQWSACHFATELDEREPAET
ncbi:MAG: oligopeptide/dipeptide transporter, ATP-binding protein [Actinomycetia bacterium]|nr:oligopeptide/dipeptide transporter, ATP-binding protein [Actinomycetes bacterium]